MPPCTCFIAREDPHSKCILGLGFSHAREAVYGTSNCKICDDFRLITLRSRLEDYERESSNFSWRASSTNVPPREIAASRRAASWGSDVELEEMETCLKPLSVFTTLFMFCLLQEKRYVSYLKILFYKILKSYFTLRQEANVNAKYYKDTVLYCD